MNEQWALITKNKKNYVFRTTQNYRDETNIWEGKDVKLRKKSKEDGSVYYDIFKGDEWCGGLGSVMMDGIMNWSLIIKKE